MIWIVDYRSLSRTATLGQWGGAWYGIIDYRSLLRTATLGRGGGRGSWYGILDEGSLLTTVTLGQGGGWVGGWVIKTDKYVNIQRVHVPKHKGSHFLGKKHPAGVPKTAKNLYLVKGESWSYNRRINSISSQNEKVGFLEKKLTFDGKILAVGHFWRKSEMISRSIRSSCPWRMGKVVTEKFSLFCKNTLLQK